MEIKLVSKSHFSGLQTVPPHIGPLRFPHGRADLRYRHLCGVIALMLFYYNRPENFWASSSWRQQTVRASWCSRRSPHCFTATINIIWVILSCCTDILPFQYIKILARKRHALWIVHWQERVLWWGSKKECHMKTKVVEGRTRNLRACTCCPLTYPVLSTYMITPGEI